MLFLLMLTNIMLTVSMCTYAYIKIFSAMKQTIVMVVRTKW